MKPAELFKAVHAKVERLECFAAASTCAGLSEHDWVSPAGCNCGCHELACSSAPAHERSRRGTCDYGDNADAIEIRPQCRLTHSERQQPLGDLDAPAGDFDAPQTGAAL
jgi:hypothetical protein